MFSLSNPQSSVSSIDVARPFSLAVSRAGAEPPAASNPQFMGPHLGYQCGQTGFFRERLSPIPACRNASRLSVSPGGARRREKKITMREDCCYEAGRIGGVAIGGAWLSECGRAARGRVVAADRRAGRTIRGPPRPHGPGRVHVPWISQGRSRPDTCTWRL